MNKAYKVIWSKVRNCYVVVSELAKRHAKAPSVAGVKGIVASVTAAAALSVMLGGYGVAWAESTKKGTFDNFASAQEFVDVANLLKIVPEFKNSTGLEGINAHSAYALGYSGKGVSLGIVDTGIRIQHNEFKSDEANNNKARNLNLTIQDEATWGWNTNGRDHGSHVAGIMAANKGYNEKSLNMQGVAYNSNIESIATRVTDGKGDYQGTYISYSNDLSAMIINNSWGDDGKATDNYIKKVKDDVKKKDRVFVFGAGNDARLSEINTVVGSLCNENELKPNFLNVVSIDPQSSKLSTFSNVACGIEKNTVAAYGGGLQDINSVYSGGTDGYCEKHGTSMAAPYVTGTLGLVKEANPYLTGKQLVDTILTTTSEIDSDPNVILTYEEDKNIINLIAISQKKNLNKSLISRLLTNYLSESNYEILKQLYYSDWLVNNVENPQDYRVLCQYENFSKRVSGERNDIDNAYYQFTGLETSLTGINNVEKILSIIDTAKSLFILEDGEPKYSKNDSGEALFLLADKIENLIYEKQTSLNQQLADVLINSYKNEDKYIKTIQMTSEEVYGQGLIDAGRAVQGIGAIDVNRLSDENKTSQYSNSTNYLYKVNTGKSENNFNKRDFSIWSNDISEKNTSGIHAGLLKSGDVDLVLLGENTYQGPTAVIGGHLQIVRGVEGDVYAGSSSGATVEINGKAKNVYALRNGKVEEPGVVITDTITQKDAAATDADFYNNALPKTNTVNIEGGLFAIGKDLIADKGSVIKVNLQEADSQIKGALYQDEKSKINVELANTAKLTVEDSKGYYDGSTYIGNNKLNELTLNGLGEVDLSTYPTFTTLNINTLSGSDGIFTVKTNLAEQKADLVKIDNAKDGQSHFISVVDKNGFVAVDEASVKVAEAPGTVTFKGFEQTVDQGVNSFVYTPKLDFIENGANKKDWYFYGFEGSDYSPVVDKPVVGSGVYTTDTVLNFGIYAPNSTLKVLQAKSPAMLVNRSEDHEYGKAKVVTGILGSVNFIGEGPVRLVVNNKSEGGEFDTYNQYYYNGYTDRWDIYRGKRWKSDSSFTAGLSNINSNTANNEYKFSAKQDFEIDMTFQNGDAYGIYTTETDEKTNAKINNELKFDGNLTINMHHPEIYPYNVKGIQNAGVFDIKGNLNLDIDVDNAWLEDYAGRFIVQKESIAVDNTGVFNTNGNININMKGEDESRYLTFTGIKNTNVFTVDGTTDIEITSNHNGSYYDTAALNGAAINNVDGNMEFEDTVSVTVNAGRFDYDMGFYFVNNESQNRNANITFDKNLKIINNASAGENNHYFSRGFTGIYNSEGSVLTVKGDISTDNSNETWDIFTDNYGKLSAGSLNTDRLNNGTSGSVGIVGRTEVKGINNEGNLKTGELNATEHVTNSGNFTVNDKAIIELLQNKEGAHITVSGKSDIKKVVNEGDFETGELNVTEDVITNGKLTVKGNTVIAQKYQSEDNAPKLLHINGVADFGGDVSISLDGGGNTATEGEGVRLQGETASASVHGNLNIDAKDIAVDNLLTAITVGNSENGQKAKLAVDNDINITIPDQLSNLGTKKYVAINNFGEIEANNIITDSYIKNSGTINAHDKIKIRELNNEGVVQIGGSGTFETVSNKGTINAKTIVTDYWSEDIDGQGTINSLIINKETNNYLGNYNIESLTLKKITDKTPSLWFENGSSINTSGRGTVIIERNLRLASGSINLTNSDSSLAGTFVGENGARLSISNGARWNVPGDTNEYQNSVSSAELNNGGIISLGTIDGYRGGAYQYFPGIVNIETLSGTGGVFDFAITQNKVNSGVIESGYVMVGKNLTENAKHTIRLSPVQTDFALTNDVKVNPFIVVKDQSQNNNGYLLDFGISTFDAGTYNYTPTLESEKDSSNVNLWKITDIKVTGSDTPVDPTPTPEPEPEPEPTPDPVENLLTVDTTQLTDEDKSNDYGTETVYVKTVNTGDNSAADALVSNNVGEVTGSDNYHGGIVAKGENELTMTGDNTYQGPTVSHIKDGSTLRIVNSVKGDVVAEEGGSLTLHGKADSVVSAENSNVLITDTVARKTVASSDTEAQKEAKEKFNAIVPETTTVNVSGGLFAVDGSVKVDLTNSESVVRGPVYTSDKGTMDISLDNGSKLIIEKGSEQYKGASYSGNNEITLLSMNNGSQVDVSGDGAISNLHVGTLSGNDGVFDLAIHQDAPNSGSITSDKLVIEKNITQNAKHTLQFTPDQADFVLTNDTKVNAFEVVEDRSETNGGYAAAFTASNFDAGVYNYTPTLDNEKDESNVSRWKVTDIKVTGSEPEPTPTPTPEPTPGPEPTPEPEPTPSPGKPVLSNLTKNTQAAAINTYYRWREEYNNLDKRLGDLRFSKEDNGLWARTFHAREDSGKYGLNSNYTAFQMGYDKKIALKKGGKWFVGGAVTSYDGKTSYVNAGRTENKSIGLALYGSYLGDKGHYVDIVARRSRMSTDLTSYATGTGARVAGDYHNWGSSIGVEYGRRIGMKNGFYVQPQAELIYGHVNGGSYNLDDGSGVSQSSVSTWTARGGVSIGRQTKKGNIFATFSVLHDFGDDSRFTIRDKFGATYSATTNLKDTWYELSIGGNAKLNDNTYLYADVEKTFGGDVRTKWRYNLGVRYSF